MAKKSVTGLKSFVKGHEAEIHHVGIDVHKHSYHLALYRDGAFASAVCPAQPKKILQTLRELKATIGTVVYEAGPTGYSLARTLQEAGIKCLVAAPSKMPRPCTTGVKTDRLDCIKLAEYTAKDMVTPVTIPSVEEEAERSLLRQRQALMRARRQRQQRIKAMLLRMGIEAPHEVEEWTKTAPAVLMSLELPAAAKSSMESLVREYEFYLNELAIIEQQLKDITKSNHKDDIGFLTSIPGIGQVVASSFLLELFNLKRFRRAEELASFLGLAPIVRQSGDSTHKGHLVSVGQKQLRSLLVEAAWMWRAKDDYAARLYGKYFHNTALAQKAICAVARKLAIIMWRLVVEQRMYRQIAA